ncbi:hypothetical protein THAOC_30910 [Thalassiosira oceanica]|uniref:Uncharacterized protein n=1 Tax=Thalassiosira oceanica TaxID=159749 RepID=K0RMP8_THAOC|nr:hypothetical protein THAOC_30910 [Thalassiosira oceanica]|eukprot:EJK50151.1 hypothetical protein THAOC_30910 [Thalassiosira oceanica]
MGLPSLPGVSSAHSSLRFLEFYTHENYNSVAPSAPPAEAFQPPSLPQAIAVPLAVQAEPQVGLPFYQRKCFISMTLLAIGAVLGAVLSNSLDESGDTLVPVPGLGIEPQTSSPSEDPVAGQSAMESLVPSSSVVPKTKPTSNPNINPVTLPPTTSNIPIYLPTWPPVLTMNTSLKLLAPEGSADDWFGCSTAIYQDTIVVGAEKDDDNGLNSGSAHVFVRSGGKWKHQTKLLAPDGSEDGRFGMGVAIHKDTIVVGAWGEDDNGSSSGSAHAFVRTGADWTHLAADWTYQAKLLAPDGAAMDYFGRSVAINEDTIVVGAERDDDNGEDSGSAHVFVRTEEEWKHQAKLLAPDGATDMFGANVAVNGVSIVVAAHRDDDNGFNSGSAHVFLRSGEEWTHEAKLLARDGAARDYFGGSVAIHENTIVVGANRDDDNGEDSGSAYVFLV